MTAFHYRARLRNSDGEFAIYGFTPYDMMPGVELGEFRLDLREWQATVTQEPKKDGEPLRSAARCVPALVQKIRKAYSQSRELPEEVFYIA